MRPSGVYLSRRQFFGMFLATPALTLVVMMAMVWFLRPGPGLLSRAYAAGADGDDDDAQVVREGRLLAEVRQIVRARYVEPVPAEQLLFGACEGMVGGLDVHSDFLRPEVYREEKIDTLGHFGGLGIEVDRRDGWLTVVTPLDDSPAARAGVRPGDRIVAIEGVPTRGWSIPDAAVRLRGEPGTRVRLTLAREGERERIEVTLERAEIRIQTVRGARLIPAAPGVAYLRVAQFGEATVEEFDAALGKLREAGARGLVIDLRWNPGGLLRQCVAVADRFVDAGTIVEVRGRPPLEPEIHRASTGATPWPDGPVAVLVNSASASAAEIVAGALQDHGRARLFGARTYGKGTVQTILEVDEGRAAVRLTTARYYLPKGRTIQPPTGAKGIEPDETVESTKDQADAILTWQVAHDREASPPPRPPDPQLDRAVAWVAGQLAPK